MTLPPQPSVSLIHLLVFFIHSLPSVEACRCKADNEHDWGYHVMADTGSTGKVYHINCVRWLKNVRNRGSSIMLCDGSGKLVGISRHTLNDLFANASIMLEVVVHAWVLPFSNSDSLCTNAFTFIAIMTIRSGFSGFSDCFATRNC